MTEPRLPQTIAAERAVLGACMANPKAYSAAAVHVAEQDFYLPHHRTVWSVISWLMQEKGVADPELVMAQLRSIGEFRHPIDAAYLATLLSSSVLAASVEPHAVLIADTAVRRRLIAAAERAMQRAWSGEADVDELVQDALENIRAARDERVGVEIMGVPLSEFLHAELDPPDWLVPGLLAKGDRFILTGGEGLGKSTVLQQFSVCAAAGVQPFDWHKGETFEPLRVYMHDCENPDHDMKTRLWKLRHAIQGLGYDLEDRLIVAGHGNPLNLLDSTVAMSLLRSIEHHQPDLVYVGPVYKLHMDDDDKAMVVKKITTVLDQIRATGAALLCEAHATKEGKKEGKLAPAGSNVWTQWPEFGRGLLLIDENDPTRTCRLKQWRIDRVEREWPDFISAGEPLPWARS